MKFFKWEKDGGPESTVHGLYIVEIKSLFSIVLLKFSNGSRPAFHNHAFNSVSWLLKGYLVEYPLWKYDTNTYYPYWVPIWTPRSMFHQVVSQGDSWVLSFRGPWRQRWHEFVPGIGFKTLTHGREVLSA